MATTWYEDADDAAAPVDYLPYTLGPAPHPAHARQAAVEAADAGFTMVEAERAEAEAEGRRPAPRRGRRSGPDLSFRAFRAALRAVQWICLDDGAMFMPAPVNEDTPDEQQWLVMVPRLSTDWNLVAKLFGGALPAEFVDKAVATEGLTAAMLPVSGQGARGRQTLMNVASGAVAKLFVGDVVIPTAKGKVGVTTIQR